MKRIILFDLSGRTIYSLNLHAKETMIDVEGLSGGIYFAQVIFSDERIFNSRIVIGTK